MITQVIDATTHKPQLRIHSWKMIPWQHVIECVRRLQIRIAKAWSEGIYGKVKDLQRLLVKSLKRQQAGSYEKGWLRGLSRMMRKYHVRFLRGEGLATIPSYLVWRHESYISSCLNFTKEGLNLTLCCEYPIDASVSSNRTWEAIETM